MYSPTDTSPGEAQTAFTLVGQKLKQQKELVKATTRIITPQYVCSYNLPELVVVALFSRVYCGTGFALALCTNGGSGMFSRVYCGTVFSLVLCTNGGSGMFIP